MGIQRSLGFWIPRRGFRIPSTGFQSFSADLGFWFQIFIQIPNILEQQDSGFYKHNFHGLEVFKSKNVPDILAGTGIPLHGVTRQSWILQSLRF